MAKNPWELTKEEARAEGERLREELRAADRIAAPLFAKQLADMDAEEATAQQVKPAKRRRPQKK